MEIVIGGIKEEKLDKIKSLTLDMFNHSEMMLKASIELLEKNDNTLALELIDEDKVLDDLQNDLTVEINNFIIKEQPKAIDLRLVLGTLLLIGDLERIGDNCKMFAKTLIKTDIEEMGQTDVVEEAFDILLTKLDEVRLAYDKMDHNLAKAIAKRSNDVDKIITRLISDLNKQLVETDDVKEVKGLTRTIILAKTFQRSEEHLINICEQISYINKGQIYHYS